MINLTTALFDIGREKYGDGRTTEEYLSWFSETLKLDCNFTIFTEPKFLDFVREIRNDHNTKIICGNLEDIPHYHLKEKIDLILKDPYYREKILDLNRIECNLSLYNIIQYSKFKWIEKSIEIDPNFNYYFWIDAGCSRFFKNPPEEIRLLENNITNKKFNIQGNSNTDIIYHQMDTEKYKFDNNCILVGTFFGGDKNIMKIISEEIEKIFTLEMIEQNMVNNEQIALGILYKRNPNLFSVYKELDGTHLPFFNNVFQK